MSDEVKRAIIDREKLAPLFPTHAHPPEFWEHLGRAVAAFGFLEEVLKRAIFALSATRSYRANQIEKEFERWLAKTEGMVSDTLSPLADRYSRAARENPKFTTENVADLVHDIQKASVVRNALCHGS